ncbi:MAG TPA: hypothetical protein VFN67_25120 [Polyangiales bacterium]|jgi:hypothetical protein|nr:hypothetical protein [Polyangiales bacterium]
MRKLETSCVWALMLSVTLTAALSCTRKIPEPEAVPAQPAPLTQTSPSPEPAPEPKKGPSSDFVGYPKEGWTKLKLQDTLPLCVFQNVLERESAKFIHQVKKQQLKANETVWFGSYGPYCINPECDDLPTLQCVVDREGSTLKVQSRYIGYHKDGSKCTDGCKEVTAGCETPKLEAGKYTIQYGDNTYSLKIPSTLRDPCFKKEEP